MRVISAKILDSTHLELSEPVQGSPGQTITISVSTEAEGDMPAWRVAGKQRLLNAYSDEDDVYDTL